MTDDLARLLDLPAAARLSVAGDELALLTLRHEHADKITIERRRLGSSIDLGELLQIVGLHGLAEEPRIQVSEVIAPQLPAPAEEEAPMPIAPTARRTTRNAVPAGLPCPDCERTFKNPHARVVHQGRAHKVVEAAPVIVEPAPPPTPALVAQSTATLAIPVPVNEYTCSACGVSLQLHERCSDCQALLGPEHEAGLAVEHGLCKVCVGYRATAEQLGVAA